jgi:hypothetical protein
VGYYAFFYPPVFLLLSLPFALMPYCVALVVWLGATGFAYWRVVCGTLLGDRSLTLAILAYPAVLSTAGHGQNALLSTALFGGGALLLQRRPVWAGILFGAIVFKPHLGLLIPVFLIARRQWTTLIAAGLTVVALAGLSLIIFGSETWQGFLAITPLARAVLEHDLVGPGKMVSTFAAVRLLGGAVPVAYVSQAVVALAAALLLIHLIRSHASAGAQAAALAIAALLASPFLLDYDLTLLILPLAWTFSQARRTGFDDWEKAVLLAAYMLPLVSRVAAEHAGLPLAPPVLIALFLVVARRGLNERSAASHRPTEIGSSMSGVFSPLGIS